MPDNFFKTQRDKINKSQFQVAVDAGVTPSTVAAWETGRATPRVKNAERLAQAYGVSESRMTAEIVAQSKGEPATAK